MVLQADVGMGLLGDFPRDALVVTSGLDNIDALGVMADVKVVAVAKEGEIVHWKSCGGVADCHAYFLVTRRLAHKNRHYRPVAVIRDAGKPRCVIHGTAARSLGAAKGDCAFHDIASLVILIRGDIALAKNIRKGQGKEKQ